MSSTTGRSGRSEVLAVLREWLEEADRISYERGGTYASVMARALESLEGKEADASDESQPRGVAT
jgi:hypothetical protein